MKKLFFPLIVLFFISSCEIATTDKNSQYETDLDKKPESTESTGPEMPATPDNARVFFANLEDGDVVTSPVYIEFGVEGIEVEPAGPINEGFGHHHILINETPAPYGEAVAADDTHIHFGGGQTSDTLDLPAGEHTLVLQFADGIHRSYGDQLTASIKVTVE
jgi:hypothetical protein